MSTADTDDDLAVHVAITDGGQMQPPEQEDPEEEDVEITRSEDEEEEEKTEPEAESQEVEEESEEEEEQSETEHEEEAQEVEEESEEEAEPDEGADGETTVLDLTIDGLFLDLLGLEVDLDEVHLDIIAKEGEGKLLGNLLSAVGGLLDSPNLLGGMDIIPSVHPIQRAKALAGSIADRLRGLGDQLVSMIPFEQILTRFFQALVDRLLPVDMDEEEEQAQAA